MKEERKMKKTYQMSDSFRTAIFIVLSGGLQDAYTYNCRGKVYANAQTGNVVLMSTALFQLDFATAFRYLIPLLAFIGGVIIAEYTHGRLKNMKMLHWRQLVLLIEIVLLFTVPFMPETMNSVANAVVSFVCAMQVQTFAKVHGQAYASTMCIGNMRSGSTALCNYFRTHDKAFLNKAGTYFGVIFVFGIGAGLGSVLTRAIGFRAIWGCCILLSISFLMMFVPEIEKEIKEEIEKK
jgi:uncharacterized membrane protein YoaK (UPF0700 family)